MTPDSTTPSARTEQGVDLSRRPFIIGDEDRMRLHRAMPPMSDGRFSKIIDIVEDIVDTALRDAASEIARLRALEDAVANESRWMIGRSDSPAQDLTNLRGRLERILGFRVDILGNRTPLSGGLSSRGEAAGQPPSR